VNNAGVFIPKPFTEYTAEDFQRAVDEPGRILYVSQLAVAKCVFRNPDMWSHFDILCKPAYRGIASKPCEPHQEWIGVGHSFARNRVADEGIRFNAIAPGVVNTTHAPGRDARIPEAAKPFNRLAR